MSAGKIDWRSRRLLFQVTAKDGGGAFTESAVFRAEGSEEMAVDVEFADDFTANKNRNNDLGLGLERTGEVAGVRVDIINDDGLAAGSCGAANTLI